LPLSRACFANSVMWNEIPLAQNLGKGFMFSNGKQTGGRVSPSVGAWGKQAGRDEAVTPSVRSDA
jgi:hypothetical protein